MTGDWFDIESKRVFITGGTAGIGKAVAEHFLAAGCSVVVAGSRAQGAATASGIGAGFVNFDVAQSEDWPSALDSTEHNSEAGST